jgi:acetyltransferase-like isoleucine patch superfamily enzyme
MKDPINPTTPGTRDPEETALRDAFLQTGKLPFGIAMRKGLKSFLTDPWLMAIQHMPGPLGFKLRQIYYRRRFRLVGNGFLVDPEVDIIGPENISLGDFAYIGRGSQLVAPEGYISIGDRCHLTSWILGHGGVEIGNCVGCAGAILSASDTYAGGARMSGPMVPSEQRNLKKAPVVIEDDAFIGRYSMVMPGVRIGQGAIVGPHSLVVRNVKPWTVVMGSPAKKIGDREPVKFDMP